MGGAVEEGVWEWGATFSRSLLPESGAVSGVLTSPSNCFLQVQLDNLPGMSLVAGKALSSARMSDAVLSQSSLMGSQQFQDGENEGEEPSAWGTPEMFLEGPSSIFRDCAPLLQEELMGRWSHSIPQVLDTAPFPTSLFLSAVCKGGVASSQTAQGSHIPVSDLCDDMPSTTLFGSA